MKNPANWVPSRVVKWKRQWRASRNVEHVAVGSRLAVDLSAAYYGLISERFLAGRLLDLGCGRVPYAEMFHPYVTEHFCVDWAESLHAEGAKHLDLIADLNKPVPLQSERFDCVVLSDVLEHFHSPETAISESARVLRKDGILVLNTPFLYGLHECPHDYYRYTEYSLRRMITSNGLELLEMIAVGGVGVVVANLVAKRLASLPYIGCYFANLVQWLAWIHARSKISLCSGASPCPIAYFAIARKR